VVLVLLVLSMQSIVYSVGYPLGADGADRPVGIVEHYTRNGPPEGWHRLWDGCRIHWGLGLGHAASKPQSTEGGGGRGDCGVLGWSEW